MKHVLLIIMKNILILVIIVIILLSNGIKADPRAIIYKGKVNIGLLIAAHLSNSSLSVCDTINFNGLHNAMATVWSLHMFNQRQRANNFDEIGVFIYDTCDDLSVAKRQTVRMISHLHSFGNRICREAKGYPPLIGVIAYGHTFDASLDLLSSFGVPIITTSTSVYNNELTESSLTTTTSSSEQQSNRVFTVAPALQYLAKAVISFVKYLDWQSVSLVISDEERSFDRKYLLSLAREGRFAIVKNYNNFDATVAVTATAADSSVENYANEDYPENYSEEKIFSDFGSRRRIHKRDEKLSQSSSSQQSSLPSSSSISTIFFLSTSEAIHLLTNLIGNEGQYSGDDSHASNYNNNAWIIATLDDMAPHILHSSSFLNRRKPNLKRNIFLVSPVAENTTEYQRYFESMVKNFGGKSDQPFLADYSQTKKGFTVPNVSVSSMVKAVWVLTEAYQNLYNKECRAGSECKLSYNNNIPNMMADSLRTLNTTITSSGHKQIDGFSLNFDALQQLTTWKFQLKLLSPNWNLINVGSYGDDTGLSINTRLLNSINNRQSNTRRIKFTTKLPARVYPKAVIPGTLTSLGSSNMPIFKQAVYSYQSSQYPFTSMRSSPANRQQMSSMASSPMGKLGIVQQTQSVSTTPKPPPVSDSSQVTRKKHYGLTAWLGNLWSMIILGVCILGILITLYVQTFLLMKSCEGALRKSNQGLVMFHLIAVMSTFLGSALYVFYPTSMMCSVRNSVHNLSLSLLFGSLLLRAMHIRSQKSIGLGGRTSRINQFLTLVFIVGIQAALEFQRWKYETPWKMLAQIKSGSDLPKLCNALNGADDYMKSQIYLTIILILMLVMSWSARNTPFNQREGTQVLIVSFVTIIIFIVSNLSTINVTKAKHRDVIISLSMNGHAFIVLIGIFIPLLYTIHKYGAILAKPSSYADSLSTIFTTFHGNNNRDLDNMSHNSNDSRNSGRAMGVGVVAGKYRSNKFNKHLQQQQHVNESTNFFARVSPNHYIVPYDNRADNTRQSRANLVANPLYEGVPGFRSAYP